jgi:hypothetical protein
MAVHMGRTKIAGNPGKLQQVPLGKSPPAGLAFLTCFKIFEIQNLAAHFNPQAEF